MSLTGTVSEYSTVNISDIDTMGHDEILKIAIAYKHENIISSEHLKILQSRIIPLDDTSTLNHFIINAYSYSTADTQFSLMTEFLTSIVEELNIKNQRSSHWWNIAETRSLIDFSITHIFNRVIRVLETEGYIHAERYAKGLITEAHLTRTKESVIYRLEGS